MWDTLLRAGNFVVLEVPAAYEQIDVYDKDRKTQVCDLERVGPEEDEVEGKRNDQGEECGADSGKQAFLLASRRLLPVPQRGDSMGNHEHAPAEEMVVEGEVHRQDPVAVAIGDDEEEAEDQEDGDNRHSQPVSEFLLSCSDRQQSDQIAAHGIEQSRGQQDGYQGSP